jgi:hypothetical protein
VEELPEVFGELQSLEDFNASGCSSLARLPESFGQLSNLERLDLHGCGEVRSLPPIYRWAHEVDSFEHIGLRIGRTSEGFGGTTKSSLLQCKWLFLFVKVTIII